jgi:hypothetical protein
MLTTITRVSCMPCYEVATFVGAWTVDCLNFAIFALDEEIIGTKLLVPWIFISLFPPGRTFRQDLICLDLPVRV